MKNRNLDKFSSWFASRATTLRSAISPGPFPPALANEVSREVARLNPQLRWEIGPCGPDDLSFAFAFGCSGRKELLALSKSLIGALPKVAGWTFLPAKPRKEAERMLVVRSKGETIHVDFSRWTFELFPEEGGTVTIGLVPTPSVKLNDDELEGLGWMLVDFELGEELALDRVVEVRILRSGGHPIAGLYAAVAGSHSTTA